MTLSRSRYEEQRGDNSRKTINFHRTQWWEREQRLIERGGTQMSNAVLSMHRVESVTPRDLISHCVDQDIEP